MITQLRTAPAVIDALGGNQSVAELTSSSSASVSNWKAFKKFPANTYVAMRQALFERGFVAPDDLWSMRQPATVKRRRSA